MIIDDFKVGEFFYSPPEHGNWGHESWGLILEQKYFPETGGNNTRTLECINWNRKYVVFNSHTRIVPLDRADREKADKEDKFIEIGKQEFLNKFFRFFFEEDGPDKDFDRDGIKYNYYNLLSNINF